VVVCIASHRGCCHDLTVTGERFIHSVAESIAQVAIAVSTSGNVIAVPGLSAKPTMVAAAS
jgi:hypothetical protein